MEEKIYVQPICGPCTFGVACKNIDLCLEQLDLNLKEKEKLKFKAIKEALRILGEKFSDEAYPVRYASILYEGINNLIGIRDPYKEIKKKSNEICLSLEDYFWIEILKGKDFKTQLYLAIIASITGNLIDFGTGGHEFAINAENIKKTYNKMKDQGLKINDLDKLIEKLNQHKKCLYLLDNAGEIVFDKLVMKLLKQNGIFCNAMVKGGAIMNDATLEDAEMVNLKEVTDKIFTTGSNTYGIDPLTANPKVLEMFKNELLIISKGQANFEAIISFFNKNEVNDVFFILQAKCDVCADFIGDVQKGHNLLMYMD